MKNSLKILSIGAHPAVIFDQSGGTMAHHVTHGDWVGCVVLTHGARVHDEVIGEQMFHRDVVPEEDELRATMQERADAKEQETRAACAVLGVEHIVFFGADDAVLLATEEVVRRLARELREIRPDVVLTHFPKEEDGITNPHAVAGQIVMLALSLASSVDPGDSNPPHKTAQVFYFGIGAASVRHGLWGQTGGYACDVIVDITDVAEKKLASLNALTSQGYGGAYAQKRIETSDGAFGRAGNCAYGEGFISLNATTHYYLPVTDHALRMARISDHERSGSYSFKLPT